MIIQQSIQFQSPSGDSLFSDITRFLPDRADRIAFQSPSGDSLFSDGPHRTIDQQTGEICFNPLAGIRCFLTVALQSGEVQTLSKVSIP